MNKFPVFAAALLLSLPCLAADPAPAAAAAAATASEAPSKAAAPAKPQDDKTQHERLKALQATCEARADAQQLVGAARKASIAKCFEGK
jgi:hypothetical protein